MTLAGPVFAPLGMDGINWINDYWNIGCDRHVLARAGYLVLAPCNMIGSAVDTIVGLGFGCAAIASLGLHKDTFNRASRWLSSSKNVLAYPAINLIRAINPRADFPSENVMVVQEGHGLIAEHVDQTLLEVIKWSKTIDCYILKHVTLRLALAVHLVAMVVARVADLAIGAIALPLALVSLGLIPSLNNTAYRGLKGTGVICDIWFCTMKMINPYAGQ